MSKITGTITSTVTIGSGGFKSPLTITSTGVIAAYAGYYKGRYGAPGLYLNHSGVATIVNNGLIEAAAGTSRYQSDGGDGVLLDSAATLSNGGTIFGARAGGLMSGGATGNGVVADTAGVTIHNTGTILGGIGSNFIYGPTSGGVGVQLFGGDQVTNTGTIAGGAGGSTGAYLSAQYGNGGDGLVAGAAAASTVSNSGLIKGGIGGGYDGYGHYGTASNGGDGVYLGSGTITNSGTILGGAGGGYYGARFGKPGDFYGGNGGSGAELHGAFSNSGTILGGYGNFGYGFAGNGGDGVHVVGYVSGTNTGVITGGTGAGYNIGGYPFQAGNGGIGLNIYHATVLNSGTITGGAGGATQYYGGNGGNGVYLLAGVFTNAGTVAGGTGGSGGYPGSMGAAVILKTTSYYQGRYMNVPEISLASSTLVVDPGAVFKGTVISQNYGYNQYAAFSGNGRNVLEVSGTSTKALSGVGTSFTGFTDISFATGAAWTIQGNGAGLTSGQEIYGFKSGDTIDVSSLHFNAKDKVSVATAGTVSITQGATVTKIDIVGATKGESDFHVSKDKTGGTDLTRGTQPKMTFLGSTISNAVVPVDKTLPPLEHAGGWMSVGNQGRDHTSVGIDLRPYGAVPAVLTPSTPFDGMFVPVTVQAG